MHIAIMQRLEQRLAASASTPEVDREMSLWWLSIIIIIISSHLDIGV